MNKVHRWVWSGVWQTDQMEEKAWSMAIITIKHMDRHTLCGKIHNLSAKDKVHLLNSNLGQI